MRARKIEIIQAKIKLFITSFEKGGGALAPEDLLEPRVVFLTNLE
jgi:hypothetical protein